MMTRLIDTLRLLADCIQKLDKTRSKGHRAENRDDESNGKEIARAVNALTDHYKAAEEKRKTDEKETRSIDRSRLRVEKAGVWVVAIGSGFGLLSIYFLADQARTTRMEKRAWVHTIKENYFDVPLDDIRVLTARVPIINSGKIPARNIETFATIDILAASQSPTFHPTSAGKTTVGILFPDDKDSANVVRANRDGSSYMLTEPEREALRVGRAYFVLYGEIYYQDDFGPHWTRFCVWKNYGPGTGTFMAKACTLFNSVGDGAAPPDR